MSTLGILARGLGEGVKGYGEVRAKGYEAEVKELMWDARAEKERIANMARLTEERAYQKGVLGEARTYKEGQITAAEKRQAGRETLAYERKTPSGFMMGDKELSEHDLGRHRSDFEAAQKANPALTWEAYKERTGIAEVSKVKALATRKEATFQADADFDAYMKGPEAQTLGVTKDQAPTLRKLWRGMYTDQVRATELFKKTGSKGAAPKSMTVNEYATKFLQQRDALVYTPKEIKAFKMATGFTRSDEEWLDEAAHRNVRAGALGAMALLGDGKRDETPEKLTERLVKTEKLVGETAKLFMDVGTTDEILSIALEASKGKSKAVQQIIVDTALKNIAGLKGMGRIGEPVIPTPTPTPTPTPVPGGVLEAGEPLGSRPWQRTNETIEAYRTRLARWKTRMPAPQVEELPGA